MRANCREYGRAKASERLSAFGGGYTAPSKLPAAFSRFSVFTYLPPAPELSLQRWSIAGHSDHPMGDTVMHSSNLETIGGASEASVTIEGLSKSFAGNPVIIDLNISFRAGAISVLLGPSGCGKTTILRCIAGLEEPDDGEIRIYDRTVFSARRKVQVLPEQRNLGMVFQSYAIWPHMTVHENVALPLRAHGVSVSETKQRVQDLLQLVGLDGLGQRSATQLSGGQQQRVAVARCLANRPDLVLLDEPLSNLDAKLRVGMRWELKQLQRTFNATMIFVTHDQEEAMSLADEIFLFRSGQLEQRGSGSDLYRRPRTRYVAEFFGKANLFRAMVHPTQSEEHELKPVAVDAVISKGHHWPRP